MMKNRLIAMAICLCLPLCMWGKSLHVAKTGNDSYEGTEERPFLTIGRAADVAQPGDVIIIHEGTYRECVVPPRGGDSDKNRIVFQAAEGEQGFYNTGHHCGIVHDNFLHRKRALSDDVHFLYRGHCRRRNYNLR